jgi:RTX calcium-binding nonapeptide repeat (4 copies)
LSGRQPVIPGFADGDLSLIKPVVATDNTNTVQVTRDTTPTAVAGDNNANVTVGDGTSSSFDARGGNDIVLAGAGADSIDAGTADDRVFGEAGLDNIPAELTPSSRPSAARAGTAVRQMRHAPHMYPDRRSAARCAVREQGAIIRSLGYRKREGPVRERTAASVVASVEPAA